MATNDHVSVLAAIVLAVIALIILDRVQEPADRAFTTPYTRVGDQAALGAWANFQNKE